ncbi:MAG: hypothetical protein ABI597_07660 [Gammaproteobacteria bacterium]
MFSSKKKPEDVLSDEDALFLQTIEKEMEKHQRQLEIDAQIETAKKTLDTADSATDLFIGVAYFVGQLLIAVPIISAVVNGAKNILSAVTAKSNEGDYTKGVKKNYRRYRFWPGCRHNSCDISSSTSHTDFCRDFCEYGSDSRFLGDECCHYQSSYR